MNEPTRPMYVDPPLQKIKCSKDTWQLLHSTDRLAMCERAIALVNQIAGLKLGILQSQFPSGELSDTEQSTYDSALKYLQVEFEAGSMALQRVHTLHEQEHMPEPRKSTKTEVAK